MKWMMTPGLASRRSLILVPSSESVRYHHALGLCLREEAGLSDLLRRATALAAGAHFRSKQSSYSKNIVAFSRLGQYHPSTSRLVLTPPRALGRKP